MTGWSKLAAGFLRHHLRAQVGAGCQYAREANQVRSGAWCLCIDPATGTRVQVGTISANAGTTAGLALDPASNTVFPTSTNNDSLYALDLATGAVTSIVSTGAGNLLGLVYAAVIPEPSTYALFGLGLAGLVAWQRRRRRSA